MSLRLPTQWAIVADGTLEIQELLAGHVAKLPIRDARDLYSYVGKIAQGPL